jgi:hypothetical protein
MPAVKPRLVNLASGLRSAQPAAATVAAGALYYVTDEDKLERNSGSAWAAYSQTTSLVKSGNVLIGGAASPGAGTNAIILTTGTVPSSMGNNTTGLYAKDVSGTVELYAINEAGTSTQLSGLRPVVLIKKTTTQSLTTGLRTAVAFDVEAFDIGSCHDNVTNNTRLTVPTGADGTYFITANVEYASNTAGLRAAELRKNGATTLAQVIANPVVGDLTVVQVITLAQLVSADYVELNALQTSGGALNVGTDNSSFSWTRL